MEKTFRGTLKYDSSKEIVFVKYNNNTSGKSQFFSIMLRDRVVLRKTNRFPNPQPPKT